MFGKKNKKKTIPKGSKLYGILCGIDDEKINEIRKQQGFVGVRKIETDAKKVDLVRLDSKGKDE